jgi:hypothetical protein
VKCMNPALCVLVLMAAILSGCWPDDQPAEAPAPPSRAPARAEMPAGIHGDETVRFKYRKSLGESRTHETATGAGASIDARGNDAAAEHDATAPTAQLSGGNGWDGGGASGGTLRARLTAITPASLFSSPFAWAGVIGLAAAGWLATRGLMRQALMVGLAAGAAIVAAVYPWAILIGVGLAVIEFYRNAKGHEVARGVLAGIESIGNPNTRRLVKAKVEAVQDKPGEREWLRAMKRKDQLPAERADD